MADRTFNQAAPDAIILAAGKGTRMGGDKAKVLYEAGGKPMLAWVVEACRAAGVARCIVVVGYAGDEVRRAMKHVPDCLFVEQAEQLGTGHATRMAQPLFENQSPRDVFVLAGDGPLIRASTLQTLLRTHRSNHAAATLATSVVDDPAGYGRVVRNSDGSFRGIVEQKDATPEQLAIREINPSYYCFASTALFDALGRVRNNNRSKEYYLTDVPTLLLAEGKKVCVVDAVPPEDVLSVNTPVQLAEVDRILRARSGPRVGDPGLSRMKERV